MVRKLMDFLKAIDTYEKGYVLDRELMQLVYMNDVATMKNWVVDDVFVCNVLLNNFHPSVAYGFEKRIVLCEIDFDMTRANGPAKKSRFPLFHLKGHEAFDAEKFDTYLREFGNQSILRIIEPNYVALEQFLNRYGAGVAAEMTLEQVGEAWSSQYVSEFELLLPKKFVVDDDLFFELLKHEEACKVSGDLLGAGVRFELMGEWFVLRFDVVEKRFELSVGRR